MDPDEPGIFKNIQLKHSKTLSHYNIKEGQLLTAETEQEEYFDWILNNLV